MRGRHKTPTAILEQRGSWRAKTRPDEPQPPAGRPTCPAHLSKKAKTFWKSLIPDLMEMGILARIDGKMLERYCTNFVRWREAIATIAKEGETFTNENGLFKARPEVTIASTLDDALRRMEIEFGLTPSSRARLKAPPKAKPSDPDDELFPRMADTG